MTTADDARTRLSHVIAMLSPLARGAGAIGDWRDVWLSCTLAIREIEATLRVIRKQLPVRARVLTNMPAPRTLVLFPTVRRNAR